MVNKKLATLLVSAVMLGQFGAVTSMLAQADTQLPVKTESPDSELRHVASVINNPTLGGSAELFGKASTPDIYMIGGGAGTLPTIVQVLPQDDDNTSLFVNGSEILRFHGVVDGVDSYHRVKAMADKLKNLLVTDADNLFKLRPAIQAEDKQAVIRFGDDVLTVVDEETAKTAQETQNKLAFLYTDRLRRALGEKPLQSADFPELTQTAKAEPAYKATGRTQTGMASWYGGYFHGRRAADGSRFNQYAMTAAHKTLPFGTIVKVVNHRTKKSCYVRITDRGPFVHGRIIDLSRGAAASIGMLGSGVAKVTVEIVKKNG